MSEWKTATIGEIAEVLDGPHATPRKISSGPWFLSISSLDRGRLELAESAHLSEEDFHTWTRRVTPQEGDVLFSYETRLGEAALMPSGLRACLGRRMAILRPRPGKADSKFLLYAYLGPEFQDVIRQRSIHGATVERIPLVSLPEWPIRLPDLRSQQAIAEVLGALDDKIAVNGKVVSRISALLEACFTATMRSANRRTQLHEIIDLRYGRALKEVTRTPGPIPVYGGNGISGWHQDPLVGGPGIIVGRKGANAGSISWSQGPFWVIDTAFYVEPKDNKISHEFILFLLDNIGLRSLVGDSAIPGLNREIALSCEVRLPSAEVICHFTSSAKVLLSLREHVYSESRVVAGLRDALLPKLMSGEILVRDAGKVVEEVT